MSTGFTSQQVEQNRRRDFIEPWVAMAEHCKDLPADLIVYDLINEPAGIPWNDYNRFMKEVTGAIRRMDRVHAIFVEFGEGVVPARGCGHDRADGRCQHGLPLPLLWPHTGDVHRWGLWHPRYRLDQKQFRSHEGREQRMLSPLRFMICHQAEVMHGEFGINFLGPDEAPRAWLEDVLSIYEKYPMHWNWWDYSGREIHRTGLVTGIKSTRW